MAWVILGLSTLLLLAGLALMAYFVLNVTSVDANGLHLEEFWA